MKKFKIFILLFLITQWTWGQTPKWVEKNKRAVFSVTTYDKEGKMLHTGNGFFVHEEGVAVSDYSLFKGAEKAVIVNYEGKEKLVSEIMGANELYDIIKFRVDVDKKVQPLEIATVAPTLDSQVYMLPYSTKRENNCIAGTVKKILPIPGGYSYYTLAMPYHSENISCPVLNPQGQAVALLQKNASHEKGNCFALSASFALNLSINALSLDDLALRNIGIKKALPQEKEQALVSLFLNSSVLEPDAYLQLLNDFIVKFPDSPQGYIHRATLLTEKYKDSPHFSQAENDLKQALSLSPKKDDIHYNYAKLIYHNALSTPTFKYKGWELDKALLQVQQALAIDSMALYRQLEGDIYFAMQNYPKAFESYQQVNRSNLVSPTTYYSAAKSKELMDANPAEVIALLDSALSMYPYPFPEEAALYVLERAQMKSLNNQYREAIMDYNLYYKIVKGDVNDLFYYYREQSNYKAKLFEQALNDIQKAMEIKPGDPIYLAEQGAVLLRLAKYDQAINSLEEALTIDPTFASCYRIIGYCLLQQGKKEQACQNFAKAKELGDKAVDKLIEYNCQ